MKQKPLHKRPGRGPAIRWQLWAAALVVTGLTGCSSVSQKWSQWRGKTPPTSSQAQTQAPAAPVGLQASSETGHWLGVYSYQADSGRFLECKTGQTVPVLMEGDNALLENAYMVSRSGPNTAMLATVDGRIVERPVADPVLAQQGKKELALRVERFVSLSSATSCAGDKAKGLGVPVPVPAEAAVATSSTAKPGGSTSATPAAATTTLDNTYWKLLTLNGKAVAPMDKEPHIVLQSQGKLVGSGGCNRLMGSWKQEGAKLHIGQVAGTRMACRGAAATTEIAMLKMLERVAGWRIHGEQLELLDAKGKLLAQWKAVALR